MAIEAHIRELSEKHRHLDRMIAAELARPGSDDMKIQQLKREKLKLRDRIENLRQGLAVN